MLCTNSNSSRRSAIRPVKFCCDGRSFGLQSVQAGQSQSQGWCVTVGCSLLNGATYVASLLETANDCCACRAIGQLAAALSILEVHKLAQGHLPLRAIEQGTQCGIDCRHIPINLAQASHLSCRERKKGSLRNGSFHWRNL